LHSKNLTWAEQIAISKELGLQSRTLEQVADNFDTHARLGGRRLCFWLSPYFMTPLQTSHDHHSLQQSGRVSNGVHSKNALKAIQKELLEDKVYVWHMPLTGKSITAV